ncbi:hypothetical protein ACFQZT_00775 [Paenibacillus sp. GCM10027628]|uniref:hypothetical protein n=1 Tax=Paenibacillus sp. GCM10027628 TaxID=3273413 RepID=UPI003644A1C9
MYILYAVISALLVLIGTLHCCLTRKFNFQKPPLQAIWFFGCGFLLIIIGLFNFALLNEGGHPVLKLLCLISNLMGVIFAIALLTVLKKVQVYVSLMLLILLTGLSIFI